MNSVKVTGYMLFKCVPTSGLMHLSRYFFSWCYVAFYFLVRENCLLFISINILCNTFYCICKAQRNNIG